MTKTTKKILRVIYTLIFSGILLIWIMQDSINAYWTQTYHQQSPLVKLSQFEIWEKGADIHRYLTGKISSDKSADNRVDEIILDDNSFSGKETTSIIEPKKETEITKTEPIIIAEDENIENKPEKNKVPTVLPVDESKKNDTPEKSAEIGKQVKQSDKENTSVAIKDTTNTTRELQATEKPVTPSENEIKKQEKEDKEIVRQPVAEKTSKETKTEPKKETENTETITGENKTEKSNSSEQSTPENIAKEEQIKEQDEDKKVTTKPTQQQTKPNFFTISKGQMVFFAGDSMMQGVAPHVKATLHKKYGIKSIDLSKQSTGLTYPSFFNWPKTITTTLNKNPSISLLVVFLGANDPWNMPNPKGGKYLKFQSEEWEQVYREKIRQIITTAREHNVDIMWLEIPDMRKKKLNKGVRYLNTIYQSEIDNAGAFYLPTQFLLTGKTVGYSKYVDTGVKKIAVRTNDGIHFTRAGQKRIANRILHYIKIKEETK